MKRQIILVMTAALFLAGCGRATEPVVIVPKAGAESHQSAFAAGQENQDNTTMREQLHLPERYQASFEEGGLSFFADAEISIPDVTSISVKKTEADYYSMEEYERIKEYFRDKEKIAWGEETDHSAVEGLKASGSRALVEGKEYFISYYWNGDGKNEDYAYSNSISEGVGAAFKEIYDYDTIPQELQSEEEWAKMRNEAETLMGNLGYGKMKLVSEKWIEGTRSKPDDSWEEPTYMRVFGFSLAPDGIGAPAYHQVKRQDGYAGYQQYATLTYTQDGSLSRITLEDKEQIIGDSKERVFLLPFSEVASIFESVEKSSYEDYFLYGGAFADERKVTLRVKEARLGYMGIHDVRNREREKEGKMIPVWDFLGSVSVEYFKEGKSVGKETYSQPDLSLMTINAMDGSVMERRDMGK